jgi:hypothetical protein
MIFVCNAEFSLFSVLNKEEINLVGYAAGLFCFLRFALFRKPMKIALYPSAVFD